MEKEDLMHLYNGVLLNHKKEQTGSFVKMLMDLKSVIQSEVSQKEKNKYHILMHIYGIYTLIFKQKSVYFY